MIGRDNIKLAILLPAAKTMRFHGVLFVAGFGRVGTSVHWLRVSLNEIELLCLQYI